MTTSSTSSSSETTVSTSISIKREVIDRDSPPSAMSSSGEAAAVAAAAAAAVVQRHFHLGLTSSPSAAVSSRRSALGYSATAPGSRAARIHSTPQPETCVCEVCQVELGRYEALFCHKLLHFNTANVCYVCDLYFAGGADELRLHVATHHRDIAGLHPKASDTAFVCPVCVQRFSTSKALMRHQAQLHSPGIHSSSASAGRKITCAICTVDFANERELLGHLVGAQHKDMKIKLQSIFICIDCRSIFSNRDAYAFHMMTRAQNETCDVITAAAAAAAAEVGLSQNHNGDVTLSSSIVRQQALTSPPPHGHRQATVDARPALMDTAMRSSLSASDRYSSVMVAASTLAYLGGRLDDDTVGRRWLRGRVRNGPHGRVAAPLDKRSGTWSSLVVDSGTSSGGHSAPLNLTCQTANKRSTTATSRQTNTADDSCRHDRDKNPDDWSLPQSWKDISDCSPVNGVGIAQRRSMSARSDAEERPAKLRRRTCWSVDNISDEPRLSRPILAKPVYADLVVHRRQQSHSSPAINSYQQNDMTDWRQTPAASSADYLNYCNDVVTTKPSTPLVEHSSHGARANVGHAEPVPDRLLVDETLSRVHPPGRDDDLRAGGGGRDDTARECPTVGQEPVAAADDDDDDALRQLLRMIQQPDGQPVFLCRHCDIIYADRMLYALHMGLHNVNNPWQCNICGTTCSGRQQFALHALHY